MGKSQAPKAPPYKQPLDEDGGEKVDFDKFEDEFKELKDPSFMDVKPMSPLARIADQPLKSIQGGRPLSKEAPLYQSSS